MKRQIQSLISSRVAELRTKLGLSHHQLATSTGLSIAEISSIENGDRHVSAMELLKIAEALRVSPTALFADGTSSPPLAEFAPGFAEAGSGYSSSDEVVRLIRAFDAIAEEQSRREVLKFVEGILRLRSN